MDNPEKTVEAYKGLCAPTVFSGLSFLVCPYGFLWIVHPFVPLRFSLDCPPLWAPAVFSGLSFFCAPAVFSGLSFFICPYSFLWIFRPCMKTVEAHKDGQSRENRRGTQERTTQRKPQGPTRVDNPEKTVEAPKGGQSRENRRGCPPFCASTVFSGLSTLVGPCSFLWVVFLMCPYSFLWSTQGRKIQRKLAAHKGGQSRENRRGT
jgi:hypothetical protein